MAEKENKLGNYQSQINNSEEQLIDGKNESKKFGRIQKKLWKNNIRI